VIAYGRDYSGARIGIGTHAEGMEQPAHVWDPSIAPSGHIVYSGRLWPEWAGHHFVGSLNSDFIARLDPDSGAPRAWAEERIAGPETIRVRAIAEAPDGSIWFLSVGRGAVFRMAPAPDG
jgi:glucose/arabinose dehydrogenase